MNFMNGTMLNTPPPLGLNPTKSVKLLPANSFGNSEGVTPAAYNAATMLPALTPAMTSGLFKSCQRAGMGESAGTAARKGDAEPDAGRCGLSGIFFAGFHKRATKLVKSPRTDKIFGAEMPASQLF